MMTNNYPETDRNFEKNEEASDLMKLNLLNKYKIEENDPILSVIDYLDNRLKITEKDFRSFRSQFDESNIKKMLLFLDHQSINIEKRKITFGLIPGFFMLIGLFSLALSLGLFYERIYSTIFSAPILSINHLDNKTHYFIKSGYIKKVEQDDETGAYHLEVEHVAPKVSRKK